MGEKTKRMNSEQTTRSMWRNIYCILRSIDKDEVKFSDPRMQEEWDKFRWSNFRDDPHGFIVRCDTYFAEAIWQAVERRM